VSTSPDVQVWVQAHHIWERCIVIATPHGTRTCTFDWAAAIHEQLESALARFLDPTPLPEAEPPTPIVPRPAARSARQASLEELI
jgi:hypothetical protein